MADLTPDSYLVIGLATCFVKEEGEVKALQILEPIPSAALEALVKGIPTSYKRAWGTSLACLATPEGARAAFGPEGQLCDDFTERALAAARTYQAKPEAAELIPLGTTRADFNYSVERKRVLNSTPVVRPEDNVKQHAYTHQVL